MVINLDTSKISSAIASCATANEKIGFVLNKKGYVESTSSTSRQWLEMSAFDNVKKANTKSHQQIMYEILDLNLPVEQPIIQLSENEKLKITVKDFIPDIDPSKTVIGLNVGIGKSGLAKVGHLKDGKS